MIASIPNIIGWLAISFAKVSLNHFNILFSSIHLPKITLVGILMWF